MSALETLQHCPVCQSNSSEPYSTCIDHTVSQQSFLIVKCTNCGFLFTNPRPSEANIGQYYQSDDYISHSNTSKGLINTLYQWVRNYTIKRKCQYIAQISGLSQAGRLLDIGCGTGEFLHGMQQQGWQVEGLEPSPSARALATSQYQLSVSPSETLYQLPRQSYDVITLWHVLEHVHDLSRYLDQIRLLLKPSGKLIIAVPNAEAHEIQHYRQLWAAYDVPRHLYHFTMVTMDKLMNLHHFQRHSAKNMPFDSFYVALLSEKYAGKAGLMGMIRAFLRGLGTNIAASRSLNAASSIQYVYTLENSKIAG
jgi:2-polyprenyl-3-methyl-5-hydroxy-6-metoxy-1,4-benzoquinol methylase